MNFYWSLQWVRFIGAASLLLILIPDTSLAKTPVRVSKEKQKSEEIISKHLLSIGSTDARMNIKTRVLEGLAHFRPQVPGQFDAQGTSIFASEGTKSVLGMKFSVAAYQKELIAFDGVQVTSAYFKPGDRSVLSDYLLPKKVIFQHGLFGGVLSTGWALLHFTPEKADIEYGGVKKLDDTEAYLLRYKPKGSSDVTIQLYFEKSTFHHIRTDYEQIVSAQMGETPEKSAQQITERYRVSEEFDDFWNDQGLVLPHYYKLIYSINGGRKFVWHLEFQKMTNNQVIDPKSFVIFTNK